MFVALIGRAAGQVDGIRLIQTRPADHPDRWAAYWQRPASLVAALGIDGNGDKHPLGLVEGATENTAVLQALIDNLIERGLDPTVCRLFIIDGAEGA